jgi:formylglycine-generating enzyme required for sulfatase activity
MIARKLGKSIFLLDTTEVVDNRQIKANGNATATLYLPDFLKERQYISMVDKTEEQAHEELWLGLFKEGLAEDFSLPERPYPGLQPFGELDAAVFFGRQDEIRLVRDLLTQARQNNANRFILILGASGCGKSSLVRAGVIPRLERSDDNPGLGNLWAILPHFRGRQGLEGLAISLTEAFRITNDEDRRAMLRSIRKRLVLVPERNDSPKQSLRALREIVAELRVTQRVRNDGCVLIVVDQLEEVFVTNEGSNARNALRLLLEISADEESSAIVLATMRSDFLNLFQQFEGAAARYRELTIDPMLRSRFGEVIKGPADYFGLELDAGLIERMVDETAYNDALPLLAFTLRKLYERCETRGQLTLEAYDQIGGVSGSIERVANRILEETGYTKDRKLLLEEAHPRMRELRRAFYGLARVSEDNEFTRRIALWSKMPASCGKVLKRLVGQRLLVSGTTNNGEPSLSVAHEALFRVWDTLRDWLRQDRNALTLRSQIEEAATEWDAAQRSESRQWSDERILDAIGEINRSGVSLDDMASPSFVRAFLGPTDSEEIAKLLNVTATDDTSQTQGKDPYGDAWRLPLSHQARASAGVRLAVLGDRRPGVGLRGDGLPDICWHHIRGGKVTIGICSNPVDPLSEKIATLTRIVQPFWLARYPVTISQFRAFVTECHQSGLWHLPADLELNRSPDNPPPKHRARYGNHPADSVSWWDSVAFCRWLSLRLGFEVRLPTEFEWQLAATGGACQGEPVRAYPWGSHWDLEREPWRANIDESGLGRVTAVGMYPGGAAPSGQMDMAGTVWEWCLNAFDNPENTELADAQDNRRAIRGGSWGSIHKLARCTLRYWYEARVRIVYVGFRVMSPSPILDP